MKKINKFIKQYKYEIILTTLIIIMILLCTKFNNMFGSDTDWINQHTIIPEYFREIFYKTGKLIPNLALNYGGIENIYNLSYYGFLSPLILPSYLLPFISMTTYITIVDILVIIISSILFFRLLKKHKFTNQVSFVAAFLLTFSESFIFQMHRHIMFVNYMPFLIMGFYGIDKLIHENKKILLIISVFLMIMTSYYYSVCGILVLGIYYILEYFTYKYKSFKQFCFDLAKFIFCILIAIMMSSVLLIPTALTLLSGRGTSESSYTLISLLTPYLKINKIFSGTYSIGLSLIAFISLIYLFYKKKTPTIIAGILTSIVLFIPLFRYLLNGGLYLREKCFIPFLPLMSYFIAMFLQDLFNNKIKSNKFIILISLILGILYYFNQENVCYLIIIGFIILLFIHNKKSISKIISTYLIITSFIICIKANFNENYVTKETYNDIFSSNISTSIKNIIAEDNTIYRMNNLDNSTYTVNKIYDAKYFTTNIYSSTYNNDYLNFVRNEFNNSMIDYNYFLFSGNKNILFNSYMGVKYLYSSKSLGLGYTYLGNNIYKNNFAYPLVYGTNITTSYESYKNYQYPYNLEILLKSVVIEDGSDDIVPNNINKIDLEYSLLENNGVIIKKTSEGYILEVLNDTGEIKLQLKKPLKNKLLFINLYGLEENSCSIDNINMTINDVSNVLTCKTWIYSNKNNIFHYLINDDYIDIIDITLTKGIYNINNIKTFIMDYEALNNLQDNITSFNISNINSSGLEGDITITKENEYLVTTIPYDKGYKIYIDGEKVSPIKVNIAFLGCKIEKGIHHVKITYQPSGLIIGKYLSFIGFIICIFIFYKELIKKEGKIMKCIKKLITKYKELINYLFFGVLTTIVSLSTYYILVLTILNAKHPIEMQIANIISWITCVTFAYITNKKYVFAKTNKKVIKEMIEFYSSRLLSLFLDMGLMFLLVSTLNLNDKIVKIIIQIIIIIVNYILSKLIVFKQN